MKSCMESASLSLTHKKWPKNGKNWLLFLKFGKARLTQDGRWQLTNAGAQGLQNSLMQQ